MSDLAEDEGAAEVISNEGYCNKERRKLHESLDQIEILQVY
jgi:hypothetical protein